MDAVPTPKALSWDVLQEEHAEKAIKAVADRHLDMLSAKLAQKYIVWGDASDSLDWDGSHSSSAGLRAGLNFVLAHTPVIGVHGVHGISVDVVLGIAVTSGDTVQLKHSIHRDSFP